MTIPAGRTYAERLLYLTPSTDTVQEGPERFNYTASITIDGETFTDTVALYLVVDGWEKPIATIEAGTSPVVEGTDATFTVTLSHAVATPISVSEQRLALECAVKRLPLHPVAGEAGGDAVPRPIVAPPATGAS